MKKIINYPEYPGHCINVAAGMGGDPLLPWRWFAAESSLRAWRGIEQYEDFQRLQQ
jgi:hypothetical protein